MSNNTETPFPNLTGVLDMNGVADEDVRKIAGMVCDAVEFCHSSDFDECGNFMGSETQLEALGPVYSSVAAFYRVWLDGTTELPDFLWQRTPYLRLFGADMENTALARLMYTYLEEVEQAHTELMHALRWDAATLARIASMVRNRERHVQLNTTLHPDLADRLLVIDEAIDFSRRQLFLRGHTAEEIGAAHHLVSAIHANLVVNKARLAGWLQMD